MIWIKDNGQEIEINDDPRNVEAAESLGWKKKAAVKKAAPKKAVKKADDSE